ncbi:MAG TPA: hypothetical protein VFV38_10655 [Ktedonobacteraceae bacterium]|nr:hypothetical protein [Ktedonobacteraceae bacterium]
MFLTDLLTFVTSPVLPVWLLLIVLTACATMLRGHFGARKTYQENLTGQKKALQSIQEAHAKKAQEAETQRQAHKNTIYALQATLTKLAYVVRDTDEATEREYREIVDEHDEEYEMPEPLEGATEFAHEITCISKVLSAIHYDLCEQRISDPDIEFYQNWVNSLQSHITSWDKRRRAILRLENLLGRLNALERILQHAHGLKGCSASYSSIPVQSHQDLYDLTVPLREFLELKLKSKTGDLVAEATQFTMEVEGLEREHEVLDGALTVFYEATCARIKQLTLGAWDSVIAYAFESSPCLLMAFYQESQRKSEDEYAEAMQILADERECGQCKAVEHMSTALRHWGFRRALGVVMTPVRDAEIVRGAYDQFLRDVEAKIPQSLQELKQVMDDPYAFFDDETEEFANFPKLFS